MQCTTFIDTIVIKLTSIVYFFVLSLKECLEQKIHYNVSAFMRNDNVSP
jgi:hypothetical protein